MRALACSLFVALLSGAAFGQSTAAPPKFEIADVHGSPKALNAFMSGGVVRGTRYEIRKATMVDLISLAYGVDSDKVLGGPSWLEIDRFDVIAKVPPATSPENAKLMLQALLADRFKLAIHNESKPLQAYALTVGKRKLALKESGPGNPGCEPPAQPPTPQPGVVPIQIALCHNMTMDMFALILPQIGNAYLGNPVKNMTGLEGSFDFELRWTGRGQLAQAGADGVTIFDGVDKLGLKLEPQKLPFPVVIVDSVNQTPTANAPGLVTSLPPAPPAEFDVAEIKQTDPEFKGLRLQLLPSGQVNIAGVTLKFLIEQAWNLTDDLVVGAPKWMDTDRFDIVAKASNVTTGTGNNQQVDIDSLLLMLRNLMADRFKLKTHMEDRPVSAYTLMAAKPKMPKADPLNRTGCKEGPGADGKDPRVANPVLNRLLTCHNMTMAEFAELLPTVANGYIHTPVLDATGIDGAWDFTLSFSGFGQLQGGGGGRGGDAGPLAPGATAASDPNGALSLLDAVNRQLGVKLEKQTRPISVLVIDSAQQKPVDN